MSRNHSRISISCLIAEVVGSNIALVDTGAAVAHQLQRRIQEELPARISGDATAGLFTSGDAADASRIMSLLWGEGVSVQRLTQEFL